jgi:hypothetical protein
VGDDVGRNGVLLSAFAAPALEGFEDAALLAVGGSR